MLLKKSGNGNCLIASTGDMAAKQGGAGKRAWVAQVAALV